MIEVDFLKDWNDIREAAVRLTMALYRVSERFPESESLRRRVRECADEILARATAGDGDAEKTTGVMAKNIDALRNYLLVASQMPWVAPINMRVLDREYTILRDAVERVILWESKEAKRNQGEELLGSIDVPRAMPERTAPKEEKKETGFPQDFDRAKITPEVPPEAQEPNPRQKKILEHIAGAGQAKISDFFSVLGGVSSKTIQRDLSELVDKNFLKKQGEKRWTVYSIEA